MHLDKNRLNLIISMLIFGTIGIFVKNISIASGELSFYRAFFAVIMLGTFFLITKQKIDFKKLKKELLLLFLSGAAMGFNWILLFEAYKYTTVSAATLSYYFAPTLVTVISPLLFREKIKAKQWLCFIMASIGIMLVIGTGDIFSSGSHVIGIIFGLAAACLYASVVLLNKFIKHVDGIKRTFLQFFAAAVTLFPYVCFTGGFTIGTLDTKGFIFLFIVCIFHSGFAYCLYFSSVKNLPGQKIAILSYIDPLVAVIVSVFILRESISLFQIAGGFMVLGFTLFSELSFKKKGDKI